MIAAWALLGCTAGTELPTDTATVAYRSTGLERALRRAVNDLREERGLAPLQAGSAIAAEARAHSHDMAAGRAALGHAGFDDRVARIDDVLPVLSAGENVTYNIGFDDPIGEALRAWTESETHDANLRDAFTHTGAGVVVDPAGGTWITQLFVTALQQD
ncbi:MAG: hypothetical protein ACI8PZ_000302 [Myxococcota bacterium]